MPTVTVAGANSQTVTLTLDSIANAALARQLAGAITAGVQAGSIVPAEDTNGPPPPLPPNKTGEFVQTQDGLTILPPGYQAFVNTAKEAEVFGSGDVDESVLSSTGDLSFFATGGSGTVVAGGGNNRIDVPSGDSGAWSINTGNGNDLIRAVGGGNDTINAGGGHNAITLGSGNDVLQSTGDDTVNAGSGHETIGVIGTHNDLIRGNSSQLFFVAGGGSVTIFGGSGSDTFFGSQDGKGTAEVHGGTGGDNLLIGGAGSTTLFGGGNGDQLIGGLGNDTFMAGTGSATITAGSGTNLYVFTDGQAGGTASIQGFSSGSGQIDLQGYGKNEVANALKSQTVVDGTDTIKLSDNTTISFANVSHLTADDFITSSGTSGNLGTTGNTGGQGNDDGQPGHGHQSQGMSDTDNPGQIRDSMLGHS